MVVDVDGRGQSGEVAVARLEAGQPLGPVPAEVGAGIGGAEKVDLFKIALADVADVKQVAVEGGAPGVAQAEGKDLGRAAACGEGVGGGDGVGGCGDVDAQDLAKAYVGVLGVAPGVAAAPAVAGADV